jgi:hypothetical protein
MTVKENIEAGYVCKRFDDAEIPIEDRYLVLHPKHVSDYRHPE